MAVLSNNYVMTQVKKILPLGDTDIYDDKMVILVAGAISKLRSEGVPIDAKDKEGNFFFQEGSNLTFDYCICIAYQVLKDMDLDVDMNFMTEQYITRINTLRCYITMKQR